MATNNQQGINSQYGRAQGQTLRGAPTYGEDGQAAAILALQAQVAELEKRSPIIETTYERVSGTWVQQRSKSQANENTVNEGANSVIVLFDLLSPLGFTADLPRAIEYTRAAATEPVMQQNQAASVTDAMTGDQISAGVSHLVDDAGAAYAPADGDKLSIVVWSTAQ